MYPLGPTVFSSHFEMCSVPSNHLRASTVPSWGHWAFLTKYRNCLHFNLTNGPLGYFQMRHTIILSMRQFWKYLKYLKYIFFKIKKFGFLALRVSLSERFTCNLLNWSTVYAQAACFLLCHLFDISAVFANYPIYFCLEMCAPWFKFEGTKWSSTDERSGTSSSIDLQILPRQAPSLSLMSA